MSGAKQQEESIVTSYLTLSRGDFEIVIFSKILDATKNTGADLQ